MSLERIYDGLHNWRPDHVMMEKVICDTCQHVIGKQIEGSGAVCKKHVTTYPEHRCDSCQIIANHEYDRWATSSHRHSSGNDDDD